MRSLGLRLVGALLVFGLGGCAWPFEPDDYETRLAVLKDVQAPGDVTMGEPFEVVITTLGFSGCWRKGPDVVRRHGWQVWIYPMDRAYVGGGTCTTDIPEFRHVVTISPVGPGVMDIFVHSRIGPGADTGVTLHIPVTVREQGYSPATAPHPDPRTTARYDRREDKAKQRAAEALSVPY